MSNILIGVGGGIAAFKVAALTSQLVQAGHDVRVAMTRAAQEFVGARTFEGLTGRPAILSSTQVDRDGGVPHIAASAAADLLVIAPGTADLIAKVAAGTCDDPVALLALIFQGKKMICPAMNDAMWQSAVVTRNIETVRGLGFDIVGPVVGHLAEGYDAIGRMLEPEQIQAEIEARL